MEPYYEISRDETGSYRFTLLSMQGERILRSHQSYPSRELCLTIISICQVNCLNEVFYKKKQLGDHFWFTLKSKDGEEIAISELFSDPERMHLSFMAVKQNGFTKNVCDGEKWILD